MTHKLIHILYRSQVIYRVKGSVHILFWNLHSSFQVYHTLTAFRLSFKRILVAYMLGQISIIQRRYWIRYTRSRYVLKRIFDLWSDLLIRFVEKIKIICRILIAVQIRSSTKKGSKFCKRSRSFKWSLIFSDQRSWSLPIYDLIWSEYLSW